MSWVQKKNSAMAVEISNKMEKLEEVDRKINALGEKLET